jgi:ubiquinone/menaquinone biosynthesis C-methylase UbiE
MSVEDLKSLKSGSFDAYVSTFTLHIPGDQSKILSEAFRVLAPGGKMCFSVWGKKEDSHLFTLTPTILKEFGIENTKKRSSFHMGNREDTIAMMQAAGFVNVLAWY